MPRSADRMSFELPRYLYQRLAAEADRRGYTTARLGAEIIGGHLLGDTTSMSLQDAVASIVAGELEPLTNYPTTGRTVYFENDKTPLEDLGRVPGHTGQHVLRDPKGRVFSTGGYYLTRERGKWVDVLAAPRDEND